MSTTNVASNPQVEDAVTKIHEQVYILTGIQEKLSRSTISEVDIDHLLDALDHTVELAREVMDNLRDVNGSFLIQKTLSTEPARRLEEATRKLYEEMIYAVRKIYPDRKTALESLAQAFAHKPYDVAIIQRMIAECEQNHSKTAQPKDISKPKKLLH